MVENGGNASKAMRDAGYSPNTAKTPSKLTRSRSYKDLLEDILPTEFLLEELRKDISSNQGNRRAYLELAFKLKGLLNARQDGPNTQFRPFHEVVAEMKKKYVL